MDRSSPHHSGSLLGRAVYANSSIGPIPRFTAINRSYETSADSQEASISAKDRQNSYRTSNPKKRRNVLDNTTVCAIQPPRKKPRKTQTASSQRATLASYSTDTSKPNLLALSEFQANPRSGPKVPLSRDRSLKLGPCARPQQRYQPCREVKVMPSIEHRIDPQNPRHSAHPWDDPVVQNLNEDDSSHLCSQRNDSRGGKLAFRMVNQDSCDIRSAGQPFSDTVRPYVPA